MNIAAGLSIQEAIKKNLPNKTAATWPSSQKTGTCFFSLANANGYSFNPIKYASFDNKVAAVSDDIFGSGSDTVNMASQYAD